MAEDTLSVGKYKKLTIAKKEQQYLRDHPTEQPVSSLTVEPTTSPRRTTWYGQDSAEINSDPDDKRKSEDLALLRVSSSTPDTSRKSLGSDKINRSAPQLTILSTEPPVLEKRKSTTPTDSPTKSSGLVKFRDKKTKSSPNNSPLQRRGNKSASVYGDQFLLTNKKQRPRSTLFSNSVMRKPRNSLTNAPVSLLDTLDNKKMRTAFHDFLESEYSSENLTFWSSCEKFKKLKSEDQRNREGNYIYSQYISPSAPYQINIDHVTRRQITLIVTGGDKVSSEVFDNAQRYVFSIMENDCFPRFLNSNYYKDAVNRKNTFESVLGSLLSPSKNSNKVKNNSNNNNSKVDDLFEDGLPSKQTTTVLRRFSFGFRKNYATKPQKVECSSAPDLSPEGFLNVQLKVA